MQLITTSLDYYNQLHDENRKLKRDIDLQSKNHIALLNHCGIVEKENAYLTKLHQNQADSIRQYQEENERLKAENESMKKDPLGVWAKSFAKAVCDAAERLSEEAKPNKVTYRGYNIEKQYPFGVPVFVIQIPGNPIFTTLKGAFKYIDALKSRSFQR